MELRLQADSTVARTRECDRRYVTLSFAAPRRETVTPRAPLRLGLALDRSGSMGGRKIVTARTGADRALRLLDERDHFTLVAFDHEVQVVSGIGPATPERIGNALGTLNTIEARGNTNLADGWMCAAHEARQTPDGHASARVLLVTDGQANTGLTDTATLVQRAAELRERGIVTSTLGIGADFNEELLQGIADAGGGHFYYVEQIEQLGDMLAGELGETLEVTLHGPRVAAEYPGGVRVRLLDRYDTQRTPDGLEARLNDLASGQLVQLTFEVQLPEGREHDVAAVTFRLRGTDGESLASATVQFRRVSDEEFRRADRNRDVLRRVLRMASSARMQEALSLHARRDYESASTRLRALATEYEDFPTDDPVLMEMRAQLLADAERVSTPMAARAAKKLHFESYSALKGRTGSGAARKSE